jgi:endonuclease/exonuclease/phosphatase family metal-dependent hydrolase
MSPADPPAGFHLRVMTCNVDGEAFDTDAFKAVLDLSQPDLVALQEWPAGQGRESQLFPAEAGWHLRGGSGGLVFASRFPIRAQTGLKNERGWRDLSNRFELDTPIGILHFVCLHLETPRKGIEPVLENRWRWWRGIPELQDNIAVRWRESEQVRDAIRIVDGPILIAGDFNMPVESGIYRSHWADFTDAFSAAGRGLGHTKFTRWYGIRIDHLLAGPGWSCRGCWVAEDIESDHRPLIADWDWNLPAQGGDGDRR